MDRTRFFTFLETFQDKLKFDDGFLQVAQPSTIILGIEMRDL